MEERYTTFYGYCLIWTQSGLYNLFRCSYKLVGSTVVRALAHMFTLFSSSTLYKKRKKKKHVHVAIFIIFIKLKFQVFSCKLVLDYDQVTFKERKSISSDHTNDIHLLFLLSFDMWGFLWLLTFCFLNTYLMKKRKKINIEIETFEAKHWIGWRKIQFFTSSLTFQVFSHFLKL